MTAQDAGFVLFLCDQCLIEADHGLVSGWAYRFQKAAAPVVEHRSGLTRSILPTQESTMADTSPIALWRVVEGVFASFRHYFTYPSPFDAARAQRGFRMGGTR